jgi:SAM-dependent MidA family methyltransferase
LEEGVALGMADNGGVETASVNEASSLTSALLQRLQEAIRASGGWLPFDRFMAMALYEPGLGYYANSKPKFGQMPQGAAGQGSDFVTAPELSPLFGHTLSRQVAQALTETGTHDVWEFGAGTGALALQVLDALAAMGQPPDRYTIVDLSGSLRERQRTALARHADRVRWVDQLPERMQGVVLGNEVLDAMPVQLLVRVGGQADGRWHERGVVLSEGGALAWAERPTGLRPPIDIEGPHHYLTEVHPQGEAFISTLAERLQRGAAFFIDYGFPEAEYYHPQRHMGTLICHRAHQSDDDPLADVGFKDITAHVNFTGIALAAQDAGMTVLGYTGQGRFLINCGLLDVAKDADVRENAMLVKLVNEHEMGELFKVIGLAPEASATGWDAIGFSAGDRTHRL